ncbi:hypothetical protein [Solitalea koreensis]|uniref:Beta-lactamase-inhibitor-like, PepSY-like n=1 Tax=Solitalea koreensis TaxID=543615 RepID=A0A521EJL3_9SPHI|nr:hypothetical protein [Solitalea koreensis]SMO84118.1 hypothetical protein SAMN06265350_1169 [Solitalea koreensis]
MKIQFISLLWIGLLSIPTVNSSYAQVVLPEVTVASSSNSTIVNEKITKSFESTFGKEKENIADAKWYEINKRYLVKFIMNDLNNQALYSKNGKLIYHIVYGYEDNLPANVKSMVNPQYSQYDITAAINVKQNNRDIWMVNFEDSKKYVLVQVENNEMQETQKFYKSEPVLTSENKN